MERRARTAVLTIALIATLAAQAAHGRNRGIRLGETVAVNTHYGAPRDPPDPAALARLAAAGVQWIRNDLDWAAVERTPGSTTSRRRASTRSSPRPSERACAYSSSSTTATPSTGRRGRW